MTGIRGFRHPISVARSVMDSSEHVFFSGHGAGAFAAAMGHEPALDEWFFTEKAHKRYLRAKRRAAKQMHSLTKRVPLDALRWTAMVT